MEPCVKFGTTGTAITGDPTSKVSRNKCFMMYLNL